MIALTNLYEFLACKKNLAFICDGIFHCFSSVLHAWYVKFVLMYLGKRKIILCRWWCCSCGSWCNWRWRFLLSFYVEFLLILSIWKTFSLLSFSLYTRWHIYFLLGSRYIILSCFILWTHLPITWVKDGFLLKHELFGAGLLKLVKFGLTIIF